MKQAFSQEDKTLYLNSDTDRASYQLQFDKGRILNSQGSQIEEGVFLFVMDRDDRVFAVDQLKQWNHSFLLAGGDVIGAGMIEIDDGSVLSISNESGHYCPSTAEMAYVLDFFL